MPVALSKFSTTAEPTLEGLAGTDYLGGSVADGGQAINAMDGYPSRYLSVTTNHAASPVGADTWRIDLELNKRENFDFALLDRINLLECYQAALSGSIAMISHTSDAVGSGTAVTVSKRLSGFLSKRRPRLHFDEINDYVYKSNDADLNFGANTDFSLEIIFKSTSGSSANILDKGKVGTNAQYVMFTTPTKMSIRVDDGGTEVTSTSTTTINDDEWHHIIGAFDRDGNQIIYVDSILEDTDSISAVGDIDDVAEPFTIGIRSQDESSAPFGGDGVLVRVWNRCLSAAEVATLYAGWTHIPIPTADQWGSATEKITLSKNRDFTGGSTDWVNIDCASFDETTDLTITSDAVSQHCALALTKFTSGFTIGHHYRIFYDHTERAAGWKFFLHQTGDNLEIGTAIAGTQNYFDFTPTTTVDSSGLMIVSTTNSADGDFDNFSVIRTGCVAEYNHDGISKDQGKWLDASSNNLHGTISGCEYVDCPEDGSEGFYYEEFTAVADRLFWFFKFNTDGDDALADAEIGQIVLGKIFEFQLLAEGGFEPIPAYPGIIQQETDTGRVQTEEYYGRRDSWTLNYKQMTETQFEDYQKMLDYCKESLYPLYVIFNDDDDEPIVHRIRFAGPPDVVYSKGAANPWAISQTMREDL